jgi:hypothetical protein
VARWEEFQRAAPELAAAGHRLLYQYGIGLGFLGTVRKDGGPRLHPICPIIAAGGVFGLIGPSPKQQDLLRDGRYAIHSFPAMDVDDEFYFTGTARRIDDPAIERSVRAAYEASGGRSDHSELLFEFAIERALLATYKKRGEPDNWPPQYTKWIARRDRR